jgi:hypothetical protein
MKEIIMTKAGNLLRAAKKLISDPKDWTQEGVYVTPEGCMCAQAAINRAFKASGENVNVVDNAVHYILQVVSKIHPYHLVTTYNDRPDTSHADIMNLFDDAATMADAEPTGQHA